ncbi:MAG: BUG/TctC family periplasmic protein, partial [uncultured Craurococcus sp.]
DRDHPPRCLGCRLRQLGGTRARRLPGPAGALAGRLSAGGRDGCAGAPRRAEHGGAARRAGRHREPAGGGDQHRGGGRGQCGAGRHDRLHRRERDAGLQPGALQAAALRCGYRAPAARADGAVPPGALHQACRRRGDSGGFRRGGEGPDDGLCLAGNRLAAPPGDGAAGQGPWDQAQPRALSRHGAGDDRPDERHGGGGGARHGGGGGGDPQRQGPAAGAAVRGAAGGSAGAADGAGSLWARGLRGLCLAGADGAGADAGRHRRPPLPRPRGQRRRAGGAGADAGDRARPAQRRAGGAAGDDRGGAGDLLAADQGAGAQPRL